VVFEPTSFSARMENTIEGPATVHKFQQVTLDPPLYYIVYVVLIMQEIVERSFVESAAPLHNRPRHPCPSTGENRWMGICLLSFSVGRPM
jgi:hypothetical protein